MKKLLIPLFFSATSGFAQAADSLNDWDQWNTASAAPWAEGYDVEGWNEGPDSKIPMHASDMESTIPGIGPEESSLSDIGGTLNDIFEDALAQLPPGTSIDDISDALEDSLGGGDLGGDIGGIVDDVVDDILNP